MIALSPPPSPASRFDNLLLQGAGDATSGMDSHHPPSSTTAALVSGSPRLTQRSLHETAAGPAAAGLNNSNRSSPSPRLQAKQLFNQQHQLPYAAINSTSSSSSSSLNQIPRPAQLQRLHAQSSPSGSGSAGGNQQQQQQIQHGFNAPSPLFASSSITSTLAQQQQQQDSQYLLSPPLNSSPASLSVASPLSSPARGGGGSDGRTGVYGARGRPPSPPPMTPTSPVAGSLLFSQSPSSILDQHHAASQQHHHHGGSLPPPPSTSFHSTQSSPRPYTKLNSIGGGVASPRSTANSSSVPHSPSLPTAQPPLTFQNTGSSSSGSGNERHPHISNLQYHQFGPITTRTLHSAALARSATRSPPPSSSQPPASSSSSVEPGYNNHHSGHQHTHYPSSSASYRAASPESSVASSAFAYTASNTTNNLSHTFHQTHQNHSHQQHGSTTGAASSSSQLAPHSAYRRDSNLHRVAGSSASLASSNNNLYASSAASSRHPSRRPSLATLQSFLEGVNHVTRVRSPSLRGHSRSGSFDDFGSVVGSGAPSSVFSLSSSRGGGENQPWHLDDVDEVPSWEEHNKTFSIPTPNSPTPRNRTLLTGFTSSFNARQHNRDMSALASRRDLFTPDNEYGPSSMQTSPVPIPIGRDGRQHSGDDFNDEFDEYAERTFVDRRDITLFPDHIRDEDEQRHLRNLEEQEGAYRDESYGQGDENVWTDSDLNSLQEGDRLGIGLTHDGYPIIDALDSSPESPFRSPDDGIQYEIVRQLGYGSYAIVYLVKEILYEPADDGDHLFPSEGESSSARMQHHTVYGREFALKCLSKRNLSDEQMMVQKFEATLHRALPTHPNVVALHRVSSYRGSRMFRLKGALKSAITDTADLSFVRIVILSYGNRLWKHQLGYFWYLNIALDKISFSG